VIFDVVLVVKYTIIGDDSTIVVVNNFQSIEVVFFVGDVVNFIFCDLIGDVLPLEQRSIRIVEDLHFVIFFAKNFIREIQKVILKGQSFMRIISHIARGIVAEFSHPFVT
jgi:hypothetical protein